MARFFRTFSICSSLLALYFVQSTLKVKRAASFVSPLWLVLIVLTFLFGCGGGAAVSANPSTPAVVTTISLSPKTASIAVGATKQFQAIAQDAEGN